MAHQQSSDPPDARRGVALAALDAARPTPAVFDGAPIVLLADGAGGAVALAGRCPHAGAPLATGRVFGGCLRCPWHHAAFSLADGRPQAGPTSLPLVRYRAEVSGGQVRVTGVMRTPRPRLGHDAGRIVVVGAGAAAHGALAELAAHRFAGEVVLLGQGQRLLVDRTQLSKMALAAGGRPASLPATGPLRLRLHPGHRVAHIDRAAGRVVGEGADGRPFQVAYDRLLLATGARARRGGIPGAEAPDVLVLRSQADLAALSSRAVAGGRATVVGGGYIGLEVAAALAQRGVVPRVVLPAWPPLGGLIGEALGRWLGGLHAARGVSFVHGARVTAMRAGRLVLADGRQLATDGQPVVLGLGMQPADALAREAGLAVDDGILVDGRWRTSDPAILAAGDVAQPREVAARQRGHWSGALWQGARAAASMLGLPAAPLPAPLVWTRQFDRTVVIVGRPGPLVDARLYGDVAAGRAAAGLWTEAGLSAVASVGAAPTSLGCAHELAAGRPDRAERLLVALGRS